MDDLKPTMEARPLGFFSEWYVMITWPTGHKQRVDGFKNEGHARGWIEQESAVFLANAKLSR